jgi:hypothetical protein
MAPSQALLRTHLVFHPALCKWIVEIGRKVSQLLDGSLSMFLRGTIIFFMHVESWKEQWHLCATEIIDLIYAQCVTYIASEEGKTLDHDVWTGGKILRGKGWRTILCGLGCTYAEDSPTSYIHLNLIQHNTSNTPRDHNSATADVETGSKLIEHRVGEALREDVVNCDVVETWSTRT